MADRLRAADPSEIDVVVAYLSGELLQRRTGVGWASLRSLPPPAAEPTLTAAEVDEAFGRIAAAEGKGSVGQRRALLENLLGLATEQEQRFLRGLVSGEVRQGALESLVVDAVATRRGAAGRRRAPGGDAPR